MQVYSRELSYKIILHQIENENSFQKDSVSIQPFKVNHREAAAENEDPIEVPSLGFKFNFDGKSICYGGDTAYCENLVNMAKDSDLAIIEAGADNDEHSDLHMTMSEAIKIGKTAKEYFLVHVPE
jgi:ribonuclease Z